MSTYGPPVRDPRFGDLETPSTETPLVEGNTLESMSVDSGAAEVDTSFVDQLIEFVANLFG